MTDIESNNPFTNNNTNLFSKLKKTFSGLFKHDSLHDYNEGIQRYVLVYGGYGTLGSKCILQLKLLNWWVASVDFSANLHADVNILIGTNDKGESKVNTILSSLDAALGADKKLEAVICTTETRCTGSDKQIIFKKSPEMWTENILTPMICAKIAARYLKPTGVFILTGAIIASHHFARPPKEFTKRNVAVLMKTLLSQESGLPKESVVLGILPAVLGIGHECVNHNYCLDPEAGVSTPLQFLVDLIVQWVRKKKLPRTGSVCNLITNNFKTDVIIA